jgi:hypothetical protein
MYPLYVFVKIDRRAFKLKLKILRNTSMEPSDHACLLLAYEYLVPRGEIFGVKVTATKVFSAIIPLVSAFIPKLLLVLADYSKTH